MQHTHFLTLVFPQAVIKEADNPTLKRAIQLVVQNAGKNVNIVRLGDTAFDILFTYTGDTARFDLDALRQDADCGMASLFSRDKKLFISDMDSTMIPHETLDEVAEVLGVAHVIAPITARTMAGEIDFKTSLYERVNVLAGKPYDAFDTVHAGLTLNAGAQHTLHTLNTLGITTALVSGGFQCTADSVAQRLGFEYAYANTLEVVNGIMTGHIVGECISADSKRDILHTMCKKLGTTPAHTIAIGDGANDIPMIMESGMGIAYMGKPLVRKNAVFQINHTDLSTVLYFMGVS